MYRKITQSTKFTYILYTKITQINVWCDNECRRNVLQSANWKGLKLEMYVFCKYKQCTHYTKSIQLAN